VDERPSSSCPWPSDTVPPRAARASSQRGRACARVQLARHCPRFVCRPRVLVAAGVTVAPAVLLLVVGETHRTAGSPAVAQSACTRPLADPKRAGERDAGTGRNGGPLPRRRASAPPAFPAARDRRARHRDPSDLLRLRESSGVHYRPPGVRPAVRPARPPAARPVPRRSTSPGPPPAIGRPKVRRPPASPTRRPYDVSKEGPVPSSTPGITNFSPHDRPRPHRVYAAVSLRRQSGQSDPTSARAGASDRRRPADPDRSPVALL